MAKSQESNVKSIVFQLPNNEIIISYHISPIAIADHN